MEEIKYEDGIIVEVAEEICEAPEKSVGGTLVKLAIGFGAAVAVGVGAFVYKNRDKIEQKRIEKLKKKGYVIYKKPEPVANDDDSDEVEE